MNGFPRQVCGALVAVAILFVVGCSSPYSVDCKLSGEYGSASICATVKGPAADLAVILTDPKGKTESQTIDKTLMVTNSREVQMRMENPQEGTWTVTVKTINPEKVVCKTEITLSAGQASVKGASTKIGWSPYMDQRESCYVLSGVEVSLQKTGNLPTSFECLSLTLDGKETLLMGAEKIGAMVTDQEKTFSIGCKPLPPLGYGTRHLVKGKLSYGDHKSLDFEKEFVVPSTH